MKVSALSTVCRVGKLMGCLTLFAALTLSAAPTLRWNPASTNLWDSTSLTWLDADSNPVAWQPGAEAQFTGAGGIVNVAADMAVSNITFTANGYTLLGAGRLAVEGTLAAAVATTNSLGVEIVTAGGLEKTGPGALALARCAGAVAVQEGALLVSGSLFTDADLSVASGASIVTLGDPDTASNLILNPGFELPAMGGGAWGYVGAGNVISNWTVTALPMHIGRQNTASAGSPWNTVGSSPEGSHMLIMQYNGAVSQTVAVPADGLYSIAFSHLLRNGYADTQVYVTLDGIPLASFLNRSVQFSPGRYASAALWLGAGSHTLGISGEGGWNDRATMVDAVCFAAPATASACRALTGDSILTCVTGASVILKHSGTVPLAYVALDGTPASGTFNAAHASGIFTGSGSLSCAAPANVFAWSGTGNWSDAARWAGGTAPVAGGSANFVMRFPSAAGNTSANDLGGTFLARRLLISGLSSGETFALAGSPVALTNDATGTAPKLSLPTPGTVTVAAPVTARSALTLESRGDLTFTGNTLGLPNGSTFYKSGSGTVTVPTFTNTIANAFVYEGFLQTPSLPSSLAVSLLTQTGKSSGLTLTQGGTTLGNTLNLMGSGTAWLATRAGGGTVTLSSATLGHGDIAVFDVGAGDTLSLRSLLLVSSSKGLSATTLTKTGPGVLEIRSGGSDTGNSRSYRGVTTLRNGTLRLSEDDWGTLGAWTNPLNGRTATGTGGSLGYSDFTNTVRLGDSGTTPSDTLALIADGTGRWIGHDIEIFNKGSTVTLGMTTGTVMFAGTVTLHRDIILSGAPTGVMGFSNVVAAADFSGTGVPTLAGLAGLRIEGSFPATASLVMDGRLLSFGTYAVKAQALNALALGSAGTPGTLDVDFGAGVNDTISANSLTLSNTVVRLTCAGTGLPFAEPGTYTLFTYAGTLGGSASLLAVGNPQPGASYVFADDAANHRVTLTISGTSGGVGAVWKSALGGDWGVGANWDSGSVPDGTGVVPLFGLAITNAATVDTGSGFTVGGLFFNNASYGYTLAGSGGLTLATNGAAPSITVNAGTHTLATSLNGTTPASVSIAANSLFVLGTNAAVNSGLSLAAGTLRVDSDSASAGLLSGVAESTIEFGGSGTKLTVSQAGNSTFAGALSSPTNVSFEKSGSGTLTLSGPRPTFSGTLSAAQGTLALQAATVPGSLSVAPAGTASIQPAATNGLMGFYYNVTPNTNHFWNLAGMEAHFATLKPDLASLSGLQNTNLDFGAAGTLFPLPYGAGGSRTVNFEAVYRGVLTLPESGDYVIGVNCDDSVILAIGGQTLFARNRYVSGWTDSVVRFDAGRHDLVIGYQQLTGGYGLQVRVKPPSATAVFMLPNAWLAPYSSVSGLSGSGDLALAASNAVLRVSPAGTSALLGDLSGASGSLLAKGGSGTLALNQGGANAFAGDVDVQSGVLALAASDSLGNASSLSVRPGATLAVSCEDTVGALTGAGAVRIGGYVYSTPFTGDADSDISTAKTYTHLIDFPAGSYAPVINGVTFGNVGSCSGAPLGAWNEAPNDSTRDGTDSLLWDFVYGNADFTLSLSGLEANKTYETRLYFRNFASNPRNLTFTFSAGTTVVGSLTYNPDSATRSWVGCRYVTDAAGTLAVRVFSHDTSHTCHLYGLSNEKVPGMSSAALTLAPAAGTYSRFSGTLSGNGALVKTGTGTQAFGGANSLILPLDVQAGVVVLEPGTSVTAGVAVATGAVLEAPYGGALLGGLAGQGTFSLGAYPTNAGPYFASFTNDAGTGISPLKTYTHLLDLGSSGGRAVVNGVAFEKTTAVGGMINGYGWTNIPSGPYPGGNAANIGIPTSQSIYNLLYDFNYNARTTAVQLTGLTIGKRYEVRFYNRRWETDERNRTQTFIFDPDGSGPLSDSVTFNPDSAVVKPNCNYLGYRYVAGTNFLTVTIQSHTVDTYHMYGLSNEEGYDTLGSPVTLNITSNGVFNGVLTGQGGWVKTGVGSFTVTGNSTATGPVAVNAGAFGVAGGGTATLGPVAVAAGTTLFGHGLVGGNVAVASNAWLQAGTSAACGTLQIGGTLTLAPGARIAWRFSTTAADAFTVGGLLTIPEGGIVTAEALTSGAKPPAKTALFSSSQIIDGPADLSGWSVVGALNCKLSYSDDRMIIYLRNPRGTMLSIR